MIGTNLAITTKNYAVAGSAVVYDTDAQAYFTANTAITSSADKNAINTFYLGLKSDGIYTKIKAMYLPIWGSAASSKWNLINPLDTDAAFRLNFTTGITYSSSGITFNGTSSFANTFLIPNTTLSLNSSHISAYTRSNISVNAPLLSSENATTYANAIYIWAKQTSPANSSVRVNDNTSDGVTAPADIRGLHLAVRTASNVKKYRLNNTQQLSVTSASTGLNTSSIYIGASRNNANYNSCQISFSSIGDGLTDTEASNFYTRVQTLMTYFGINV